MPLLMETGESFFGSPFENELHQRLRFNRRGLVAMANTGEKNSNDSQFFVRLFMVLHRLHWTPRLSCKISIQYLGEWQVLPFTMCWHWLMLKCQRVSLTDPYTHQN